MSKLIQLAATSAMLAAMSLSISVAVAAEETTNGATKNVIYKKTKQGDLKLHLHFPPGWKASDKRPAIVFFFGGGWNSGRISQFTPQAEHLARRGMVAARADYRVKSRHGVTPDACVADAKSAVRYLRANAARLGIDPERIVAAGGSAGGHIAACTALSPGLDDPGEDAAVSSKPNALVLYNPVTDFKGIERLESRLGDRRELAEKLSPVRHVTKETPPALLLFGTADRLYAQGKDYMAAAKKAGVRAEMYTAEGAGHGFFNRPPHLKPTTRRVDEFLTALGYLEPRKKGD